MTERPFTFLTDLFLSILFLLFFFLLFFYEPPGGDILYILTRPHPFPFYVSSSSIIPGNPKFSFGFPSSFILISCIAPGASFDGR